MEKHQNPLDRVTLRIMSVHTCKALSLEDREMVQWLKAQVNLAENSSSASSSHIRELATA